MGTSPLRSRSRRSFLKTGIFGAAALSVASSLSVLSGCASKPGHYPLNDSDQAVFRFLNKEDVSMVAALLPVIAGSSWPAVPEQQRAAVERTLPRIDLFLFRLGDFNRKEIRQLFDLLHMRVTRGLTTGVWQDWSEASEQDVAAFMESWKHSSLALFNNAHNAFTDIIGFAWYSHPEVSGPLGYTGVTETLRQALPQFQQT